MANSLEKSPRPILTERIQGGHMTLGIEVQEQQIEAANHASVVRHGDGCIVMLGQKPFALDAETAMRSAWDLCVMFQNARTSADAASLPSR